eukprot:scaffold194_cov329-Prasinococcus_capsulatus_cf.AAC.1
MLIRDDIVVLNHGGAFTELHRWLRKGGLGFQGLADLFVSHAPGVAVALIPASGRAPSPASDLKPPLGLPFACAGARGAARPRPDDERRRRPALFSPARFSLPLSRHGARTIASHRIARLPAAPAAARGGGG